MFADAFTTIPPDNAALILERVNPLIDGTNYDPVKATVMSIDLIFYHGYQFLDISDHTSNPKRQHYVIYSDDVIHVIDYSNEPIYKLNQTAAIILDNDTIKEYARFFFTYVAGRHGRFLIVENVDDIAWKEDPPPNARKAIGDMIRPLEIKDQHDDGTYILSSHMVFKDGLFKTEIVIKEDGTVSLMNEELLIEDMPIIDDIFGH